MAYIKTNWQDHVVEYTDRYRQEVNPDGTIHLTADPGEVIQQGTPMNATNFNKMEAGIELAHNLSARIDMIELVLFNSIRDNPYIIEFDTLEGIAADGVWNQTLKRLEC